MVDNIDKAEAKNYEVYSRPQNFPFIPETDEVLIWAKNFGSSTYFNFLLDKYIYLLQFNFQK